MRFPPTRRQWRVILAGLVVLAFAGSLFVYNSFFREADPPVFASDEDHFLFGSIGTEGNQGVPYWIWLVLPRVFPDLLPAPGGYGSIGFLTKDGREMPIGLSKVTVGFPRVGINCASCHAASYRTRPDEPPTIVSAAASHQTAPQAYVRFLFAAAADPRFNADALLGEISRNTRLSFFDQLLYRFAIIPTARRELLRQRAFQDGWMRSRPDWGRGDRPVQPGEVPDARPADRRHHRQLGHGAGVDAGPPQRTGVSLGRAEHVAARGGAVVGAR